MENINDIKLMWQELDVRLSHLENENKRLMRKVMESNFHSAKEKLLKKYMGFMAVECIMLVFMTMFFLFNPEVNENYRIISIVYWDIFFLIEFFFDFYLMIRLRKIDIYSSSINEIAKNASRSWKIHKLGIVLGLPLAFGAIFLLALALNTNEFTIFGMFFGGIIGLAIGISQLSKFREYYKLLQTD